MEFITNNLSEILGISGGVFVSIFVLVKSYAKQVSGILNVVKGKSDKADTDKLKEELQTQNVLMSEVMELLEAEAKVKQLSTVLPKEYKDMFTDIVEKYQSTKGE